MNCEKFSSDKRIVRNTQIDTDIVVSGGGIAGVCAAISASREGKRVVLVQDRPVLGGNASSEVRLWILGATSHMGNNNRWAREGGIVDEILVENLYRNKEGNALIFDSILLEKVSVEKNITLLLNTSVYELEKDGDKKIKNISAFCSQNSTNYIISASYFIDGTGDGIVSFLAGASFRMGAETKDEFGELFAPDKEYGELLGHSVYFYSKDTGRPVKYVAPEFALKDIKVIPRYKQINATDFGCRFWWFEYGGRKDTIHESEDIKWELWKVVYGAWDYIKNSGKFPEAENMTLEWVGTIPGKRESRRFEGLYMVKQQDVIEQQVFDDAIAHGGWAVDLHPADGVYSEKSGCTQWHSKGVYQIPLSAHISKDIDNLFFVGRIISATHVAFGSTRVMATSGYAAQAVGTGASKCIDKGIVPAELIEKENIKDLQQSLNIVGQGILGVPIAKELTLLDKAQVNASSSLKLNEIPGSDHWHHLATASAQLLPLKKHQQYTFEITVKAEEDTTLVVELRTSEKATNYTPEVSIEKIEIEVKKGESVLKIPFTKGVPENQYAFVTFHKNESLYIQGSDLRITGVLSVFNSINKAVSNYGRQDPPENIGVDSFEFWIPKRRPEGKNIAMKITPAIDCFGADEANNGYVRPYLKPNAWVADLNDENPTFTIDFADTKEIKEIRLFLDNDYDHPMESTLMGHPEDVVPFCLRDYKILDGNGKALFEKTDNHQTMNVIKFDAPVITTQIVIEAKHPSNNVPASIFEVVVL